jgi:transcriptional regulator with XRE-family HTH domain
MSDDVDNNEDRDVPAPSQRLRLLVDLYHVEHGVELKYGEVAAALESQGISLSRARWSYMLNGHRTVDDPDLLAALADFFGVSADFLLRNGPVPDRLEAQLNLIRAMRLSKVRSFAARTLGDVSPRTLNAITQFLDDVASRNDDKR